jgi:hypothetical protein
MFAVVFVVVFVAAFAAKLSIISKNPQIIYTNDNNYYKLDCPFEPITDWYCEYDNNIPSKLNGFEGFLPITHVIGLVCTCEQVNDKYILRQKFIIKAPPGQKIVYPI